jgi:carbonic anhydrase
MEGLVNITSQSDIYPEYRDTPIGRLLEYHNLGRSLDDYTHPQLLAGTCMDHRVHLRMPEKFSYVIRTGGANLRYNEFQVSFAISVGGIRHIALIGHSQCGMVGLHSKRQTFVDGLVQTAGWKEEHAADHFQNFAPMFEIGNEADFVLTEASRLRMRYPGIQVVPLIYLVEDHRLYLLKGDRKQ